MIRAISRVARPITRTLQPQSHQFHVLQLRTFASKYPDHQVLTMPALSPTMTAGTISSWYIKEGDTFPADSSICSIETDKATLDYEVTDDGFLVRIIVASGEVQVGDAIAIVTEEECDVGVFDDYVVEGGSIPAAVVEGTPEPAPAPVVVAAPVVGAAPTPPPPPPVAAPAVVDTPVVAAPVMSTPTPTPPPTPTPQQIKTTTNDTYRTISPLAGIIKERHEEYIKLYGNCGQSP